MRRLIVLSVLLLASTVANSACKPTDLAGRWFLLSVDKNETILRCHLTANKKGLIHGKSACQVLPQAGQEGILPAENLGGLGLAGCTLTGAMTVGDTNYSFDAVMNPAKNMISGIIFGYKNQEKNPTRAMVIINRE